MMGNVSVYLTRYGNLIHLNAMCGRYTQPKRMSSKDFMGAFKDGKVCQKCLPKHCDIDRAVRMLEKTLEERTMVRQKIVVRDKDIIEKKYGTGSRVHVKVEVMPWDPHEHVPADPDEDGDVCCTICDLVLEGKIKDEAKEILKIMNKAGG